MTESDYRQCRGLQVDNATRHTLVKLQLAFFVEKSHCILFSPRNFTLRHISRQCDEIIAKRGHKIR
jgi:hypothetical protein